LFLEEESRPRQKSELAARFKKEELMELGGGRMSFCNKVHDERLGKQAFCMGLVLVICIALGVIFLGNAFAAEPQPKYQIVNGTEDKAYLLNTTTGFVWVLTYRTTATGREPVAIPYKFIKICPTNDRKFLVEDVDGTCLPSKESK
jgi:hypothetical protein